ncbi:branched-chain amino acid ABC transporter ATP-binding protein/permease [Bradyrhizobium sp. LHD-71]|uniref:branched-chain amino acid ABC transporter ATP-binding protein/permease n=1 Tax=Bradyrhizobium sp. LHD-71 TaxID=3072141 RepID=UPI00280DD07C|nr:branched-chain amino acid ABC transporter ATP-binding protein/permease [Bradyrhizobium sp. LHD-71]MDQ8728199.1 branched-chain amino acid ABC transporter ATP-binding protein/permease [Bradyrhizobium sp. LHD-71]
MNYLAIVVNLVCIYTVLATSLNLIMGYGGLFSVAHAAFFGIGAYVFALSTIQLDAPFVVALLLAFAAAALASAVISVPSLRISGDYLMLATFAIQILATSLFLNLPITGGPAGIRNIPSAQFFGFPPNSRVGTLVGFVAVTAVCWYVMFEMARSPFGRVLKAIREDELATATVGKNVMWFKISAFAAGCGFAGIAGGMYASLLSFINPDSFAIYMSFTILVMVLLGGLANPFGGLAGALALTLLQEVLRLMLPSAVGAHVSQVLLGVILVAVVMKRPQGLLPEFASQGAFATADTLTERGHADTRQLSFGRRHASSPALLPQPILQAKALAKSYGGVRAVRRFDIDVRAGEIVGLIGPNGAGKTTVFDMIAGAVIPDGGTISFDGKNVTRLAIHRRGQLGIGRLFQDARPLPNMTVLDNVLMAFDDLRREAPLLSFLPIDREREHQRLEQAHDCLRFVGLAEHASERAGSLSFGQQKLLGFARLMAQDARLWLLDEPAAGVDPTMREEIKTAIARCRRELGITVVVVEHNMDFLRDLADRVVFMADGEVQREGALAEIAADPELSRRYLGA